MQEQADRTWLSHIPLEERWGVLLSLGVSILLVGVKFFAFFLTGSAAIFSDALENVVNVLSAGFAMYALSLAHTPADADHPYGHGKVEFLSAGMEGGMILLAALVIGYRTIAVLITRTVAVSEIGGGVVLMLTAMVINGGLGFYLIGLGKRKNSATLEADGHHLLSDGVTSGGVLASLVIVRLFHFPYADPIAALLIACYVAYTGLALIRRSVQGLMDRQDAADDRLLRGILDAHGPSGVTQPQICSYHKLRHRHAGRYHWVDFHLVLPPGLSLEQGHNVASAIEHEIEEALGEANATAHVEPCVGAGCAGCETSVIRVPPAPPIHAASSPSN